MSKVTIITHLCDLCLTPPYPHHLDSDIYTFVDWGDQSLVPNIGEDALIGIGKNVYIAIASNIDSQQI